jgi:hypothetical protein
VKILIAHAEGEDSVAEEIAAPLTKAGYEVQHRGTLLVGESVIEEATKALMGGSPLILCGTVRAMGTGWAHRLVTAARQWESRIFALKIERNAYLDQLALDTVVAEYWSNKQEAIQHLLRSLEKYYPAQSDTDLTLRGPDVDAYLDRIRKRLQRLDLEGLTPAQMEQYLQLQLSSVFVEQRVRDNPPPLEVPKDILGFLHGKGEIDSDDFPKDIPLEEVSRVGKVYYGKESKPVLDILTSPQFPLTVILGDPGSGKSTLARYLMLSLADPCGDTRVRQLLGPQLPLLIELKRYAAICAEDKSCKNFFDFMRLVGESEGQYPDSTQLRECLANQGGLIIFDGLDEIFDVARREEISRQIAHFSTLYPKVRIVVTSRIVGYRRHELTTAQFSHFTLQDLERAQVEEFVERWYSMAFRDRPDKARERCKDIMRSYDESASLRQLAGNPMLLTIMAIIAKNQELPRERWRLYDHAASVLIQHWEINRHLKSRHLSEFIDEDDKREMLRRLAFKMQGGESGLAGNYVHEDQLRVEFEEYLSTRYSRIEAGRAKEIASVMVQQFHERNFILSLYGARFYGFVHRAFLEYFCATAFIHKFEKTQELSLDGLRKTAFADHWNDESWHEVLRLITGMLAPQFGGEMISYLTNRAYPQWPSPGQFGSNPPWNIALGVQCLSEIKNLQAVSDQAAQLLSKVCELFDYDMDKRPELFSFLEEQIVPYAVAVGPSWPHNENLADILRSRRPRERAYIYDSEFGTFIGGVGRGNKSVHEAVLYYAEHPDERHRVLAPFALAVGWPDEQATVERLRQMASADDHWTVRYAALYALSEHFRKQDWVFDLLWTQAQTEEDGFSRVAAINGLANQFCQAKGVLELLRDMLLSENHKYPRTVLVKALGRTFADNDEIFNLLCRLAIEDDSPQPTDQKRSNPYYVREAAIHALFLKRPQAPRTLEVMREVAHNDPTAWLREVASDFAHKLELTARV